MDRERLLELLTGSEALLEGHFVLSSGRHSAGYVQCARLLEEPERARAVGMALAERLRPHAPRSIVSPALGGLIIGHEVAAALGVPFRFTERKAGEMTMRRGFVVPAHERVAIVEDVVTTGGSTLEAAAVASDRGARVVAIGAIIDRSGDRGPFRVPFESLIELDLETWDAADCPLCAGGSTARRPGSRSS